MVDPQDSSDELVRLACPDPGNMVQKRHSGERRPTMCANCGCGIPEDRHGDERNILWSEIVASADANSLSPEAAIQNMVQMSEQESQKS